MWQSAQAAEPTYDLGVWAIPLVNSHIERGIAASKPRIPAPRNRISPPFSVRRTIIQG